MEGPGFPAGADVIEFCALHCNPPLWCIDPWLSSWYLRSEFTGEGHCRMQVTFNGIQLRHVIYHKIHGTRETFHFVDHNKQIEDAMRVGAPALVYLNTAPIQGIIVDYMGDQDRGYQVTVETARIIVS